MKNDEDAPKSGSYGGGPATDRNNEPVVDPTRNVLDLVHAAVLRQDDLRAQAASHLREMLTLRAEHNEDERDHLRELAKLRDLYDDRLRRAEAERIDAIRAVDVGNVQRAAEVQATQALALANQVVATATALETKLGATVAPLQTRIDDLTRVQYEGVGQKTSVIERRESSGAVYAVIGLGISILLALIVIASFILTQSSGP